MATTKRVTRVKMFVQSPSDRNQTVLIPVGVAFAAARGILRDTHCGVVLWGEYGVARFNHDGSGTVTWGEGSTSPGEVTYFDERTTVCI